MKTKALTDLQLVVMKALWAVGEGGVAEIATEMGKHGRVLAPTTVATLLQRLAKQRWVKHRKQGRHFMYRAGVDQKQVAEGFLRRVLHGFFNGQVSALTAQLLESEDLSSAELAEMQRLVRGQGQDK